MTKKKYKSYRLIISGISILFLCALSVTYIKVLFDLYPEVELTQEELYGERNQNLKDFVFSQAGLTSITGDPWIEYVLDKRTNIKVIELDFSGVTAEANWGEIWDMETWTSHSYDLKNGRVFVWYEDAEDLMELRFDLVSGQSVVLNVDRIIINSHDGFVMRAMKQMGVLALMLVLFVTYMMMSVEYVKRDGVAGKNTIAAAGGGITAAIMIATLYYNIFIYKVNGNLLVWMVLIACAFMGCLIMEVMYKKAGCISYVQMFLYAFLQVGMLEILSGMEYNFKNLAWGMCNILIVMLVVAGIYIISGNSKAAMIMVNVLIMILGISNHYFVKFRGNPLQMTDLIMTRTALSVVANYEFKVNHRLFFCLVLETGLVCFFNLRKQRTEKTGRRRQATGGSGWRIWYAVDSERIYTGHRLLEYGCGYAKSGIY